ncbi:lanthionine synthetase LanC family protein [Actinomadura sp. WMMA1423]|uniref:lanthionine synthetase LanC family protein n=1 Tax=Actinomadura sp. WMMA1423 TaxID=2591108 RepID=UPI001146A2FE|nr:lanthionine synthetase LanC family protein [Actinomadura sp. WMMA1423]
MRMSADSTKYQRDAGLQTSLQRATMEIAEVLRANARVTSDGSMYWRHPSRPSPSLQPLPVGPHLYAGATGIALFFAAMWSVHGGDDLRDISLRTIAPLRADIREISVDRERVRRLHQPIGGLTGLGSVIYALVRIGDLLRDETIADDAQLATAMLTSDHIAADQKLDVMVGSAGAVLALLALAERRPGEALNGEPPVELALRCARHLLHNDRWITSKSRGAEGFCHGRAGIRTALAKLYQKTGHHQLCEVLQRCLSFDGSHLPPLDDGQRVAPPTAPSRRSWCKGGAGIALGRMALNKIRPGLSRTSDLISLLEDTATPSLSDTDDLCCGNFGRVDVLVHAANVLREPTYLGKALDLTSRVLERAQRQGRYSLRFDQSAGVDLRLFPGIAGIGYSLARLQATSTIPCVVAME